MKKGTLFKGKYRIIKKLGSGGMGAVFLAENINLKNSYWAIKQIEKLGDNIDIKTEQKILTELNHPSIIRIFDVAEDSRYIYLIEEYVDGCTLLDVMYTNDQYGRKIGIEGKKEEVVISWAKQIADALQYLHSKNIVYRDLKLSNIMLDSNGRIKIIDFGIAVKNNKSKIDANLSRLSRMYAAPEQISMGYADEKSDIYSLGLVMYLLLIGKYVKIVNDGKYKNIIIEPILNIKPDLSQGLVQIIQKCLENNPNERYQNCRDILSDLNKIYLFDDRYKYLTTMRFITKILSIVMIFIFSVLIKLGVNQLEVEKLELYKSNINNGEKYIVNLQYEDALESFNEAIDLLPKNSEAYVSIASMYYQIGEYDKCINYLEREAFVKESSLYNNAECLYVLGSAYFKNEDYLESIKRLEKAVELNPHSVNYMRDLAVSYAKNNQIEKAKETLNNLIGRNVEQDITSYVEGEILLKENNINSAIDKFEESLEISNNEEIKVKAIISLSETYRDHKEELFGQAIDNQIEVLEKAEYVLEEKNNLVITEMLAKAYYDKAIENNSKEFYEKSIEQFNNLLQLGYKRPYIYRNIAIIYQQQLKNYEKAEEVLLSMKDIFPSEISCYIQLSLLYIEIENNKVESQRDYQKAYDSYVDAINTNSTSESTSLRQLESLINELRDKGWL